MAEHAASLGMPALGLTDHGVMNGAVELYSACRKHGIKPIVGLEAYLVDDRTALAGQVRYERNHLTLLAESDAGFRNLVKLTSAGFLEGFSRGKPNLDMDLLSQHSEGVIALTGLPAVALLPAPDRRPPRRRPRPSRRADRGLRARAGLHGGPKERDRRPGQGQRGDRADRARGRPPAGRHRRRPLPAARGLRQPRRAALRPDEVDPAGAEDELRHQRVLSEGLRGDGGVIRRVARGGADDARDRRALQRRDRARQAAAPALPDAGRRGAGGDAAADRGRGPAPPLRRPGPGRGHRAPRLRARA